MRWTLEEVPRNRGTSTAASLYAALHAQRVYDGHGRCLRLPAPGTLVGDACLRCFCVHGPCGCVDTHVLWPQGLCLARRCQLASPGASGEGSCRLACACPIDTALCES